MRTRNTTRRTSRQTAAHVAMRIKRSRELAATGTGLAGRCAAAGGKKDGSPLDYYVDKHLVPLRHNIHGIAIGGATTMNFFVTAVDIGVVVGGWDLGAARGDGAVIRLLGAFRLGSSDQHGDDDGLVFSNAFKGRVGLATIDFKRLIFGAMDLPVHGAGARGVGFANRCWFSCWGLGLFRRAINVVVSNDMAQFRGKFDQSLCGIRRDRLAPLVMSDITLRTAHAARKPGLRDAKTLSDQFNGVHNENSSLTVFYCKAVTLVFVL